MVYQLLIDDNPKWSDYDHQSTVACSKYGDSYFCNAGFTQPAIMQACRTTRREVLPQYLYNNEFRFHVPDYKELKAVRRIQAWLSRLKWHVFLIRFIKISCPTNHLATKVLADDLLPVLPPTVRLELTVPDLGNSPTLAWEIGHVLLMGHGRYWRVSFVHIVVDRQGNLVQKTEKVITLDVLNLPQDLIFAHDPNFRIETSLVIEEA